MQSFAGSRTPWAALGVHGANKSPNASAAPEARWLEHTIYTAGEEQHATNERMCDGL